MTESANDLKKRLIRRTGLSAGAIVAAWPEWWSDAAETSPSARAELRFSLARKLGLDPRSLIAEEEPTFTWDDSARFKGFTGNPDADRPVISSFGTALSRMLLDATPDPGNLEALTAVELRRSILSGRQYVGLIELLMLAWSMGIPVIHLRVYPLSAKRMSAMCVRSGDRFAILIARDATYPAPIAFHVAHELGHIFRGHLDDGAAIVDLESLSELTTGEDPEERDADAFGLELLTGRPALELVVQGEGRSARQLAREAGRVGLQERIEPGTVAMAFGHSTNAWSTAMASLGYIYDRPIDVWKVVNRIALRQLKLHDLPDDSESYIRAVMGSPYG